MPGLFELEFDSILLNFTQHLINFINYIYIYIYIRGVTVHKIHGSVRYDTVVSRFGMFLIGGGGNWLCLNVGNISVLNHEGKPMDIKQAHVWTKLCARFMPVNVLISVNSL